MRENEYTVFALFAYAYKERAEVQGVEFQFDWKFRTASRSLLIYTPDGAGDYEHQPTCLDEAIAILEVAWREQVG